MPKLKPKELARYGEDLARKYLEKKGYKLLDRNWKKGYGELDLVMLAPEREILTVVEVKTRYIDSKVHPKEAVTSHKISQLKTTAKYYKKIMGEAVPDSLQIDVIAIELDSNHKITFFEHIKNITM